MGGSLTPREFWTLTGIALLILVLVVANIFVFESNRTLQADVAARQQFIQQSVQLEGLNRDIISALANLSVRNNDQQLRDLLALHGITFSINPPATPASPATAGGSGTKR